MIVKKVCLGKFLELSSIGCGTGGWWKSSKTERPLLVTNIIIFFNVVFSLSKKIS